MMQKMMYKNPHPGSQPALDSISERSHSGHSPNSLSPDLRNGRRPFGAAHAPATGSRGHPVPVSQRKVSFGSPMSFGSPNDAALRNGHRKSFPFTGSLGGQSRRLSLDVKTRQQEERLQDRRGSFPPIAPAQNRVLGPQIAPHTDRTRNSLTEVVARMRVREKTLMGDDLLRKREQKSGSATKRTPNGSEDFDVTQKPLSRVEWLMNGGVRVVGKSPRTSVHGNGAVNGGKKFSLSDLENELRNPLNGEFNDEMNGHDTEEDMSSSSNSHGDNHEEVSSDDGDDDDDFDFDEGEEEISAQKLAGQLAADTESVYQRACVRLRVQPSPAFLRQVNMTVIHLRDVRLGPADVKPIAISLVRNSKLVILDLSNNDLGPIGVCYIAEMLQENSSIDDLNLSATNPGREGIRALSETLRHNTTLSTLRLEENRIEHTESHLIADMIRTVPTLRALHLGHNRLGYHGGSVIATAIAKSATLTTLDLQWNHIRRDSAVSLARALAANKSLRVFNLAWNGLGKEGCLALAHSLPKNKTLRELDLTCNRVDMMALGFLLTGLLKNKDIRSLRIGQNPLTTEGAKALIRAVIDTTDIELTEIDLKGVPVDYEFTELVSQAQESRVLHVIHEEAVTLATSDQKREHDGTNLSRYDPVQVLFEYMKMDNLRVIDMFQFMDTRKRDKLSRSDIRDALNTLKIPVTEHAIDVIVEKLDLNKDGFVELDEMMKVQRDTARQIKLRMIKAKAKNREDEGLNGLRKVLREVINKRKEENDSQSQSRKDSQSVTKTTGGRKSSVGGLQLTQAKYSTTTKRRESVQLTATSE